LDALLDQVGSAVSDVLNSVPVRLLVGGVVAYLTVVWLAAAHWVYRDMRRRRPDLVSPYLAAFGVVLASPILLPISVFTYLVLRPRETLAETRERELTDRLDAIDAELDLACPGCARPVEEHWLLCPACRTRLARLCRTCGRTMGLDWTVCGFCGREFGRAVVPQRVPAAIRGGSVDAGVAPHRVGEPRTTTKPRRELLEPGA
jgi:hypothetical protein